MNDTVPVAAYLRRIGAARPARADRAALRELHVAHLEHVPFENLDIHRGVPIELGPPSIAKIVERRRGGFCYELNGAFAALLEALGFTVTLMQARVLGRDGEPGMAFDHLCLRVDLDRAFLVDVGFGACFVEPLELRAGVDQDDPAGSFRIDERDDEWYDLSADGVPQYRFELAGRALAEFEPGCAFHQTSESHFAQGIVVSRRTERGRITLTDTSLIETIGADRTETEITPDRIDGVLAGRFGIVLDEG